MRLSPDCHADCCEDGDCATNIVRSVLRNPLLLANGGAIIAFCTPRLRSGCVAEHHRDASSP